MPLGTSPVTDTPATLRASPWCSSPPSGQTLAVGPASASPSSPTSAPATTSASASKPTSTIPPTSLSALRARWQILYTTTLPALARSNSPVQTHWPITLDHCFARVLLDNAVGMTKPWHEVVGRPASRYMSEAQLRAAVALGEDVAAGRVGIGGLDERSLALRGKAKGYAKRTRGEDRKGEGDVRGVGEVKKARRNGNSSKLGEMADIWEKFLFKPTTSAPAHESVEKTDTRAQADEDTKPSADIDADPNPDTTSDTTDPTETIDTTMPTTRALIRSDISLTPFRRRCLLLLTHIPRGRWTTYQALADAAARLPGADMPKPAASAGGRACARAVGSAMRRNPYAPRAPCHRVVASGGRIGGFGGDWGDAGRFAREKRRLLRLEGVRFDGGGRVVGREFGFEGVVL